MKYFIQLCSFYILLSSCVANNNKHQEMKDNNSEVVNVKEIAVVKNTSLIDTAREYRKILDMAGEKLVKNENLPVQLVEQCTPLSTEEFLTYYHLTAGDDSLFGMSDSVSIDVFDKLNKLMYNNAKANLDNSFLLYLNFSEFVDGEFAESYFDSADDLIDQSKKTFCATYARLSVVAKNKFRDKYKKYCKSYNASK